MSKKTWIKIKRGLLEPVHRDKLGIRIWLYLHMVDIVDWETGQIKGWKDREQAAEIQIPWRTLQRQRQELADLGYIKCANSLQDQTITITKWINPRSYSGEEINPDDEGGTQKWVPIQSQDCVPFLIHHILTTYSLDVPDKLQTEPFAAAWFEWEEFRKKEKKKPIGPISAKKQLKLLAQYPDDAVDMIETAINSSWQGLFAPKNKPKNENGRHERGTPEGF